MPILTIVSCANGTTSTENETITKENLNKEAQTLKISNFYYEGKPFDTSKQASEYGESSKISGISLSTGTKLFVSEIETNKSELTINYTLKNDDITSNKQTFKYAKFNTKIQGQVDIKAAKEIIDKFEKTLTIPTNVTKTPSEVTYKNDLKDFFLKTALNAPIGEDIIALKKVNVIISVEIEEDTSQKVVFTISPKFGEGTLMSSVIVNGFKSQNQENVEIALGIISKIKTTTIKNTTKGPEEVIYEDLKSFSDLTNKTISVSDSLDVNIAIIVSSFTDNSQNLIFKISKGKKSTEHTILVEGFKSQNQVNVEAAKTILDGLGTYVTKTKNLAPSQVSHINGYKGFFPNDTFNNREIGILAKVNINISTVIKDDTSQTVIFTISSKKGEAETKSLITLKGFSSQEKFDKKTAKDILDKLIKIDTISVNSNKLASEVGYKDIDDFFKQVSLPILSKEEKIVLNRAIVSISSSSDGDTSQKVKFLFPSTGGDLESSSILKIGGFKSLKEIINEEQNIVNSAKIILDKLIMTNTTDNTKFATEFKFVSFND